MRASAGKRVMVYGCNGYTARLLLPRLVEQGTHVVAAGRTDAAVRRIGEEFGFTTRTFDLTAPERVDESLRGVDLLLNAAGPFGETAPPLIDACLRQRVDYLDLSGELDSLAYAASCDSFARDLGVMLLPAIGFDVVASDCLAVHLARRLPTAHSLILGISPSNVLSRGSAMTIAKNAGTWVRVRRSGKLESIRWRTQMRKIDFGGGERPSVAVSWGDLVTAFHSTRIPNIEVYFEATPFWLLAMTTNQWFGTALCRASRPMLEELARLMPDGPSEQDRRRERCIIVGEVTDGRRRERARLVTTEAYTFTTEVAARILAEVLAGNRCAGFVTPGSLFGPDLAFHTAGAHEESLA